MPNDVQTSEGPLDRSFEDLVTKILATEDDCVTNDSLGTQISLTQELLETLSAGNCFENGIPPWKQDAIPDISGLSSAQLIQEALNWMQQNKNGQMLSAENENTYPDSPHNSLAGSYSSGDEVGWPNVPLSRAEAEMAPQCMNRNSPQIPPLDVKPPKYSYEPNQFNNMPPAREDYPFRFPPNRSSPINMAEMGVVQPDSQMPASMGGFNMGNNFQGSPAQSPPLPQRQMSQSIHAQDDYPPQQPNYPQTFQRPSFNNPRDIDMSRYARAQQWKNQQDFFRTMTNPRFKYDPQMAAGFPRNNYNNRYPYSSRPNHVPGWVKRNQSLNLNLRQQSPSFSENYTSLPRSPLSPTSPILDGELVAAIEDCQYQLQNLEKERRKTETELVKMNPGKRISSSNTIAVPPLPPNPSALDQLIVEEYREHSRMTTLLSKIGGLNAKALHPNIEACLDSWVSAIQSVEAHRTAEKCQSLHGRNVLDKGNGTIIEKVKILHQATSDARTRLWCALQLSKEKHIPPIKKELLNFLPEMVRLI
ncbi:uncharacterized protein LOC100890498 isoform X1 [Strongylocentrotus purpuratus]|uniref:Uncharacterized protein n=1 Tax=Strongylocentrotus purpuratus TaxID=7668 RepID=A0A7M7GNC0_STRPU|nr:uncharacterized protein LOC100890498 isoform X1 [Strongylocentrotus purpuratus]